MNYTVKLYPTLASMSKFNDLGYNGNGVLWPISAENIQAVMILVVEKMEKTFNNEIDFSNIEIKKS